MYTFLGIFIYFKATLVKAKVSTQSIKNIPKSIVCHIENSI